MQRQHQIVLLGVVAVLALLGLAFQDPLSSLGDDEAHGRRSLLAKNDPRRIARRKWRHAQREAEKHEQWARRAAERAAEQNMNIDPELAFADQVHEVQQQQQPQTSNDGGGMCFDAQPRDGWAMSRMLCGDDMPSAYGVPRSDVPATPPKEESSVAICVIGKARSFTSPLAQQSLRTNLASAFGATHTAFYFHLFPQDNRGDSKARFAGKLHSDVAQTLASALNVLQMDEAAFATHEPMTGVHRWVSETCGAEIVVDDRDDAAVFASNMERYAHPKPIREFNKFFEGRDEAFHRGFVAQWTGVKDCHDFVEREEERMGRKFDYVIKTRPDLVYSKPSKPHCMYSSQDIWMQWDWMYVLPRPVLDSLYRVYAEGVMTGANDDFAPLDGEIPEKYMMRMLNTEKSRAEYGHNGCCDGGANGQPLIPRRNDMVSGAMVLRPQGPNFPRNVCYFAGDSLGSPQDCMSMLQFNRYNTPI